MEYVNSFRMLRAHAGRATADGFDIFLPPEDVSRFEKVPAGGGPPILVRSDLSCPAGISDDSTLFYTKQLKAKWRWDFEIRRARPENGPSQFLGPGSRLECPGRSQRFRGPVLSPDGKWLAMPCSTLAMPAASNHQKRSFLSAVRSGNIIRAKGASHPSDHHPQSANVTSKAGCRPEPRR